MTRYEHFECWLTLDEWKEWKTKSVERFSDIYGIPLVLAKRKRDEYLKEQVHFRERYEEMDDFDNITNHFIRWHSTRQGHSYWQRVNERTAPIRTVNTPNLLTL